VEYPPAPFIVGKKLYVPKAIFVVTVLAGVVNLLIALVPLAGISFISGPAAPAVCEDAPDGGPPLGRPRGRPVIAFSPAVG
jgi:hypothetical protein